MATMFQDAGLEIRRSQTVAASYRDRPTLPGFVSSWPATGSVQVQARHARTRLGSESFVSPVRLPSPVAPMYTRRRQSRRTCVAVADASSGKSAVSQGEREELLALLPRTAYASDPSASLVTDRVQQLLLALEASPTARPATSAFAEFAIAGSWDVICSTSRTVSDGTIRIRRLVQTIDPSEKTIVNRCFWTYVSPDGDPDVDAILEISNRYSFADESSRLLVELVGHQLQIQSSDDSGKSSEEGKLPQDMKALITALQRSIPLEFFDPSGPVDISYVDPGLRIMCTTGERFFGLRSIFVREES